MSSISPDELAAPFGVDSKELDKPCTEAFFSSIADLVHPWRLVFAGLLCQTDMDDVDRDSHSQPEKRLGCLRKWRSRCGDGATFRAIIAAVLSTGNLENAQALCRRITATKLSHDQPLAVQPAAVSPGSENSVQPSQSKIAMVRSNEERIKALFTALVLSVQAAIAAKSDVKDVRHYLMRFFDYSLPDTTDLDELFTAVSLEKLWDYQHHSPLESIATHFLHGDQEIEKSIKDYKARLSGFYVMTKLVDFMEYKNLSVDDFEDEPDDQPPPVLTSKEYRRLKVVLKLDRKISELSLEYVHKLWCSFAEEYDIPSLTAVLERVAAGSLEITWIIPLHLSDKIVPRSKFFRRHGIVQVSLDDVILYDEQQMADYESSFLELCHIITIADIDWFSFFLKKGVDPDIFDEYGGHPLFYAIYNGREDLVELLMQYHADVDLASHTGTGEPPLIIAIGRGNYQMVELLLNNSANVNRKNKTGHSPLWWAAHGGHRDIVQLLLDHHANVDLPNDGDLGDTALIAAVGQGHYEVVDVLLRHGANVNLRNKAGLFPLGFAAHGGHRDIVQLLLDHHANVDLPSDDEHGLTPLSVACECGHLEVATVLVQNGANVDYVDKRGTTPLGCASFNGHTEVVDFLLSKGADINKGQMSPLYTASQCGRTEAVKFLVSRGAKIDQRDDTKYGGTPLITACGNNHLEVVRFLIDHGADVNLQTKDRGFSPLHFASQNGHTAIVNLLVHSGAQLEMKNKEGRTALMLACWKGYLEIVKELLRAGARTDTQDQEGLTALILATQKGHTEVVKALLDAKADPNITENTVGWSAVFFAAKSGRLDVLQCLINGGARVDIRDKNGLTPSEVTEREDVRQELERHSLTQSETEATDEENTSLKKQDSVDVSAEQSKGESPDLAETGRKEEAESHTHQEEVKVDTQDQPNATEEKERRDLVKESYRKLLKIFDVLEDSLLPGRREKRLHQQRDKTHSNIEEANRQMMFND